MPSRSAKQANLMRAIAHGWKPPKGSGIKVPVKVAEEYVAADREMKPSREAMMEKIARRRARQLAK